VTTLLLLFPLLELAWPCASLDHGLHQVIRLLPRVYSFLLALDSGHNLPRVLHIPEL
jgi:hypothetical protein